MAAILQDWIDGRCDELAVWEWTQARKQQDTEPREDPEDELVRDVLDVLVGLPFDAIVTEDAHVMLDALSNPANETDLSQNMLWNHLDGVDVDTRREALRDHPFYGQFIPPDPPGVY